MRGLSLIPALLALGHLLGAAPAARAGDPGRDEVFDDSGVGEVRATMDPGDLERLLDPDQAKSNEYLPAAVRFRNRYFDLSFDGAGIRLRGNYSRHAEKKGFKIALDAFDPGADVGGISKLNLVGEHNDPCILREKLASDALRAVGSPVSRASHLRFYLNGEYRGLYIHVEDVDESFLRDRFGSAAGNLYKCQYVSSRARADLRYRPGEDYESLGEDGKRVYELETERRPDSFEDLAELIDVINNTPASRFVAELERRLDVAGFLRSMAFDVLAGSWDSYWGGGNNYYLYNDPGLGRFRFIPRDWDMTFGLNSINSVDYSRLDIYRLGPLDGRTPLISRVLAQDHYRNLFSHFVDELLDGPLAAAALHARVEALKAIIRPAALSDTYRTRDFPDLIDYGAFDRAFTQALGGHVRHGLHPFIDARAASARAQLAFRSAAPAVWGFALEPAFPRAGEAITCAIDVFDEDARGPEEVEVKYAWGSGDFQEIHMRDDGAHGDGAAGDGRYGAVLPGGAAGRVVRLYVEAEDRSDRKTRSPADAPTSVHRAEVAHGGPLLLNEFMAINQTTIADEGGEYADWLELWNRGPAAVDLSGYRLADAPWSTGWALPEIVLEPGAFLLVWADGDEEEGENHASFRLDGDGEWLGLFRGDRVDTRDPIDVIGFGPQAADISLGRTSDGDPEWVMHFTPTPGATNSPADVPPGGQPPGPGGAAAPALVLGPSWPNPLHTEAWIPFAAPGASRVRLDVVDVTGRLRRRLLDGAVAPGTRAARWDGLDAAGRAVPSGTYVLRLEASGRVRSRLVSVVR